MDKKTVKKLIENKTQDRELYSTEKVLGDLSQVYRIADFWDINADLMELIAANELIDYAETENFTPEQYAAFRAGIGKVGEFMQRCANERKQVEELKIAGRPIYKDSQ